MRNRRQERTQKAQNQRDPKKKATWREIFSRQKASGLSQTDFCKREGIKVNTFWSWKREIRARDREAKSEARDQQDFPTTFLPLVLTGTAEQKTAESHLEAMSPVVAEVRVSSVAVSVLRGADAETLRTLLVICKETFS